MRTSSLFKYFTLVVLTVFSSLCALRAEEKIYAIMVTGKDDFHYNLALRSIESFLGQTYPNKQLLIINDGNYNFDHLIDDRIKEIHLEEKLTLGELRNIGLDAIEDNAIWVQWDDDDWHHPNVLLEQYAFLCSNKAQLCCMSNQIQYCFRINSAWISKESYWGTIMCRNKPDMRYKPLRKKEDTCFFSEYRKKYKAVLWSNPSYYYIRFLHGHNTWDEAHFRIVYREKNSWKIPKLHEEYLLEVLDLYEFVNLKN